MKSSTSPFTKFRLGLAGAGLGLLSACSYTNGYKDEPAPVCTSLPAMVSYKTDVLPIFQSNCFRCHSAAQYQKSTPAGSNGSLNMESFASISQWTTPAVNGVSYMVGSISHTPGFITMPYDGVGNLDACQIATIKAWVNAGAPNN